VLLVRACGEPEPLKALHEVKHDGFRVIARKAGERVRLYSRPGNDLTYRFPLIVEALAKLRSRSCIIDGEAVSCGPDGIANFDRIRYRRNDADVFMWTFDLIEFNGDDLRREQLAVCKATLERVIAQAMPGIRFNEHLDHEDGPLVFLHACKLGLEGVLSKRRDPAYASGRSPHWIKSKNPNAPAVRREAEDWGQWPARSGRRSSPSAMSDPGAELRLIFLDTFSKMGCAACAIPSLAAWPISCGSSKGALYHPCHPDP
jgi:bifunctional non-homologous end joining protein LigD